MRLPKMIQLRKKRATLKEVQRVLEGNRPHHAHLPTHLLVHMKIEVGGEGPALFVEAESSINPKDNALALLILERMIKDLKAQLKTERKRV